MSIPRLDDGPRNNSRVAPKDPQPSAKADVRPGAARAEVRSSVTSGYAGPRENRDKVMGVSAVKAAQTTDPALQNQRDLADARVALGQAQMMVQQCAGNPDHLRLAQTQLDAAQKRVADLEKVEASLPQADVEKARFVVFGEQMAKLEEQYGTSKAVQMARQVYYDGGAWADASGAPAISDAEINLTGLPHGARHPDGNGGFLGEMRTPDGQRIDMGHVMCAVDFQVNASRQPATMNAVGPVNIGNPFNPATTTLIGDLASADLYRGDPSHWFDPGANQNAIAGEGNSDWRGDIDGLNLANRMNKAPMPSFAQTLNAYYSADPPPAKTRVDEFASYSPYVVHDSNGQPVRDANGRYQMDEGKLAGDSAWIATLLSHGFGGIDAGLVSRQVAGAFSDWMDAERQGKNGIEDR